MLWQHSFAVTREGNDIPLRMTVSEIRQTSHGFKLEVWIRYVKD
jgi:hypothetical protein